MAAYRWKCFDENEDRPEKPRSYGVTEMRSPHYTLLSQNVLQVFPKSLCSFLISYLNQSAAHFTSKCLTNLYVNYNFFLAPIALHAVKCQRFLFLSRFDNDMGFWVQDQCVIVEDGVGYQHLCCNLEMFFRGRIFLSPWGSSLMG